MMSISFEQACSYGLKVDQHSLVIIIESVPIF